MVRERKFAMTETNHADLYVAFRMCFVDQENNKGSPPLARYFLNFC